MDIKSVAPALSVSGQIVPGDLAQVAAAGFKSLICNRPDGEGADQPAFAEVAAAAQAAGYDMSGVARRIVNGGKVETDTAVATHDIVIVGGGAAGIAVAASLKARKQAPIVAHNLLKDRALPPIYWKAMLRGKEWMAKPELVS